MRRFYDKAKGYVIYQLLEHFVQHGVHDAEKDRNERFMDKWRFVAGNMVVELSLQDLKRDLDRGTRFRQDMWLDLLKMAGDFPQTFYKAADALSQSAYHTLRDNAPINWIKLLEDAIFKVWTVTPRDWEESTTETLDGFELQATIHFLLVKFAELDLATTTACKGSLPQQKTNHGAGGRPLSSGEGVPVIVTQSSSVPIDDHRLFYQDAKSLGSVQLASRFDQAVFVMSTFPAEAKRQVTYYLIKKIIEDGQHPADSLPAQEFSPAWRYTLAPLNSAFLTTGSEQHVLAQFKTAFDNGTNFPPDMWDRLIDLATQQALPKTVHRAAQRLANDARQYLLSQTSTAQGSYAANLTHAVEYVEDQTPGQWEAATEEAWAAYQLQGAVRFLYVKFVEMAGDEYAREHDLVIPLDQELRDV
ncbi:hypothetical protein OHC33_003338 [Knufia fluminis]|uniref:Uncharacterized protein n=1 Tax=Knufia fluminis TaxID=191047 RepID=A0AAN8I5L6_9EURO|nr:hypothetical protein OHC33_003338 [Knufia fluminis]